MLSLLLNKRAGSPAELSGEQVFLRAPQISDYESWSELRRQSREHLTRWEPDWTEQDLSRKAYRLRLRFLNRVHYHGLGLSYFVFDRAENLLVGGVTLSNVARQSMQSATIGYWIGAPFLKRGFGYQSICLVRDHAFSALGLNRVEAACQPGNAASRALLKKAGFTEEGLARDYLYINGGWRDHVRHGASARDFCGAPKAMPGDTAR